jgi:hypothetical protein
MIHVVCAAQIDCGYITILPVMWVLPFFDNSFEPGRSGRICIPSACHWTSAASVTQNYSYNKTNETHYFLKFILGIELYVFRTVSLSIIRTVHTAVGVYSARLLMMDRETL